MYVAKFDHMYASEIAWKRQQWQNSAQAKSETPLNPLPLIATTEIKHSSTLCCNWW